MRVAVLCVLAVPGVALGQNVNLSFSEGRVTLTTKSAGVRQILDEWARIGGTRIVNGDKLAGEPLTLQLDDLPEARALEIILRSASGYMLAPRALGAAGASRFDRVLILPTSVAKATSPSARSAVSRPSPSRPVVRPAPFVQPPTQQGGVGDGDFEDDYGNDFGNEPSGEFPGFPPGLPRRMGTVDGRVVGGVVLPPQGTGNDTGGPPQDEPPPVPQPAGNPFGSPTGSGLPGVINPVPTPRPQTAPPPR